MAYSIKTSKRVLKYLKKLKEKKLKERFIEVIFTEIGTDPYSGEQKSGDLAGIWTKGFSYQGTTYRVAYVIQEDQILLIVSAGSHENFYLELKRFFKD